MIFGIGSDIIHLKRIEKVVKRHPIRLPEKLLSLDEWDEFNHSPSVINNPTNYLAKRWAAKEAFAKACGTGIRSPVLFPDITIKHDTLGKPIITTYKPLSTWLKQRHINGNGIHLSLSDDQLVVMAFVVLEYETTN